jgi:DNA polymerase I
MADYATLSAQFYGNRLLFGSPAKPGVVAAEVAGPRELELFRRDQGALLRERVPLRLFILLGDPGLMTGFDGPHTIEALQGAFNLGYLACFDSLPALEAAKRHLRKQASTGNAAPYLVFNDPVQQHLMLTGTTFFVGLGFDDLRRLQIDIQIRISPGFEFPSAARDGDRLAAIALTDSTGFATVLSAAEMDEKAMLRETVRIIAERDPDVIEGHNLMRFVLEYLEARARRHGVGLRIGRDRSAAKGRSARLQIAERTIAYRRYEVFGRSLVDTWLLAQHYDIARRELAGFGLEELESHFGLAAPGRVHIDPSQVSDYLARDPAALAGAALENAHLTGTLAAMLGQSYFIQAQIFPYSFQNVIVRGNATKIDSLLVRAYLDARHSIPLPNAPEPVIGGFTEVRRLGVARDVLHCDVTSLYPSLMLQFGHAPAADRLGVFLKMLADLTSLRVQAKALSRELEPPARTHVEALQQTFKILINSFYGYLGFSMGHFNDFRAANEVTRRGRELIQQAVAELEKLDAQVIEVDTDGIYFVPPPGYADEAGQARLIDAIAVALPAGIRLEIDGHFPAMFSYKTKNYVLMEESGALTIKGSGLRSRGLERFQRRFMEELFALLLAGRHGEAQALLAQFLTRLERHELPISDLMKTETLQDSLEVYRQKISGRRRNVAAAYELALKAERPYQSGDQISYYVAGRGVRVKVNSAARMASDYNPAAPDENVEYYQAKLRDLYDKFAPYVERPGLFEAAALMPVEETRQSEMLVASDGQDSD